MRPINMSITSNKTFFSFNTTFSYQAGNVLLDKIRYNNGKYSHIATTFFEDKLSLFKKENGNLIVHAS